MLSRALLGPIAFVAIIFLYLTWEYDSSWSNWLIPIVVAGAVVVVMAPQIDWWWWQRKPPHLDPPIEFMLRNQLPFFRDLPIEEHSKFRARVALSMKAYQVMPQGIPSVPTDIIAVLCANHAIATYYKEKWVFKKFENIVCYGHPFPSPQFEDQWHASELFEEDGVLLFSVPQIAESLSHPDQRFNLALYENIRAMAIERKMSFPDWSEGHIDMMLRSTPLKPEFIQAQIGLKEVHWKAIAIVQCIMFPHHMAASASVQFEQAMSFWKGA